MNGPSDSAGLTRREVLARAAILAGGFPTLLSASPSRPKTRSVILLWLDGGPSQVETFDPQSSRAAIPTNVPGLHINELMPRMAKWMNHATLIRGVSQPEISHDRACRSLLTYDVGIGHHVIPPSLGSLVSCRYGSAQPYVAFGNAGFGNGYGGAGTLGARFEPKVVSPKLAAVTNQKREPALAIERYGNSEFGTSCLAARRAIESGTIFVTVVSSGWDTHANAIETARDSLVPNLDRALSALIEDLHQRGLLESILLVVMGEFGRTAQLNALNGRDHDPETGFVLFAGAGVPSGHVITDRPGTHNITSTILWKLGIRVEGCHPISDLC